MDLTEEDVLEILNLIEKSHFDYFRLQSGELNLTVSKGGYIPSDSPPPLPQATQEKIDNPCAAEPAPLPEPAPEPDQMSVPDGLKVIAATMVGTIYLAPEPGAAPFVEVGARVEADATVGLIEVMKVFTSVPAGVAGTIREIKVANAQFVEKGATLFFIAPDEAPEGNGGK